MGLCSSSQVPPTRQRQSSIYSMNRILDQLHKQQQDLALLQQEARLKNEYRQQQLQWERSAAFQNMQEFNQKFNQIRRSLTSNNFPDEDWQSMQQEMSHLSSRTSLNRIDQLQKHNKKLLKQITSFKKWKQKSLLKEIFRLVKKGRKTNLATAWEIWRPEALQTTGSQQLNGIDLELSSIMEQNNIDKEGIKKARHLFDDDMHYYVQNNNLMKLYYTYNGIPEKPFSKVNVFKFFQEMMDKKYEADKADLQAKRPMRTLTEFTWDHLNRAKGLNALARKALNQVIPTLQDMYNEKHHYGVMICRFLHLFHPEPIMLPLAVFLTKARYEFCKLESQNRIKLEIRDQKRGKSPISGGKHHGSDKAFLVDAINLVYNLFQTDKFSRGLAIKSMKPDNLSATEYILFRICHKIVKMAYTPQQTYDAFNTVQKDFISRQDLIYGVRKVLQLYVNHADFQAFFSAFDNCDRISKEEFSAKTNLKLFYNKINIQQYTVSKGKFLNGLIQAYKLMQIRDSAVTRAWVGLESESPATFEGFQSLMLKIDPVLTDRQVGYFYQQASALAFDHSPEDAFCKVVIKFGVGLRGLRDFRKFYIGLKMKGVEYPDTGYIEQLTSTAPVKLRRKSYLTISTKSRPGTPVPEQEPSSPTFGCS